ncbi:uncharacterized protein LOC115213145 [Argonauta hians]
MAFARQLTQFHCPLTCERLQQLFSSFQIKFLLRPSLTQGHTNFFPTRCLSSVLNQEKWKMCSQNPYQISVSNILKYQDILRVPCLKNSHYSEKSARKQKHNISLAEMTVRLANENGYLSWNRNGYLATAVAVAMHAEGKLPIASEVVFSIAGSNIAIGCAVFSFNLWKFHTQIGISRLAAYGTIIVSILHVIVYLFAILAFKGYTLDEKITS